MYTGVEPYTASLYVCERQHGNIMLSHGLIYVSGLCVCWVIFFHTLLDDDLSILLVSYCRYDTLSRTAWRLLLVASCTLHNVYLVCCTPPFPRIYGLRNLPGDPDNEHLYTNVDQFHMQKDKIDFGGGGSDSDDSVRTPFSRVLSRV